MSTIELYVDTNVLPRIIIGKTIHQTAIIAIIIVIIGTRRFLHQQMAGNPQGRLCACDTEQRGGSGLLPGVGDKPAREGRVCFQGPEQERGTGRV